MRPTIEAIPLRLSEAAKTSAALRRPLTIALTAFLTVVDLFAAQAILPKLTTYYNVTPAHMAVAVNASTIGMALASLFVALFSSRLNRRRGILLSLLFLGLPTALLAYAPNLSVFFALRVVQGLLMASAFGLTLAHLGESLPSEATANAFAAYITGNVASNLVGRFIAASVADHFGLIATFYCLALLNAGGALLVYFTIQNQPAMFNPTQTSATPLQRVSLHLANPHLRASFAIGFCILFAFIGTFSFVNFVLMHPPFSVTMMDIGIVYFVFLPSIVTTGLAGRAASRYGARPALLGGLVTALAGMPLLLAPSIGAVLLGMALVAAGTFFAQAIATGYASRIAPADRGAASGLYLASYFFGGIAGATILGRIFDAAGWSACVAGIAAALLIAILLSSVLHGNAAPTPEDTSSQQNPT